MNRIHLVVAVLLWQLTSQQGLAQQLDAAPLLRQSIRFAGGSALNLDYLARPWTASAAATRLAALDVRGSVRVAGRTLEAGGYRLLMLRRGETWLLLCRDVGNDESWDLEFEASPEHAPWLECTLTSGADAGHGLLRVAFGDHALELPVTPVADDGSARPAPPMSAEVGRARREIRDVLNAVRLFQLNNRREIPLWQWLITPDERGHCYFDATEPLRDPWGNEYVIGEDPNVPAKAVVRSFGPDGDDGTDDDIRSDALDRATAPRRATPRGGR